jgi:hypothetical protein
MHGRTVIRRWLANEYFWLAVYLVIVASATQICVDRRCNNFLIFRAAFEHLLAGRDMYVLYPAEHADLYKYSPTFALFFAPFARLPFDVALLGWNLLNVMLVFQAIRMALPREQRLVALQLTGIGLVATVDGTQSNGLVAALIVLAFVALERNHLVSAAFTIALGALVKLFPLAAVAFALPRRDRIRFAAIGIAVGAGLVALPLVFTNMDTLIAQYRSWYAMGAVDALDRGASVMRMVHIAFRYGGPNWPIQLAGTILLLLPLVRRTRWEDPTFRRRFLASLLVYAVIFNHKAEQPSFIIAIVGVAIWYAISDRTVGRSVVTGLTFAATMPILLTVAAPGVVAESVDGPLLVTSLCCTAAWLMMQGELLDVAWRRAARTTIDARSPLLANLHATLLNVVRVLRPARDRSPGVQNAGVQPAPGAD